ncbi:MAG: hypothetical protein WAK19_09545, partial [Candidatus Cybelea sp.]
PRTKPSKDASTFFMTHISRFYKSAARSQRAQQQANSPIASRPYEVLLGPSSTALPHPLSVK